MIELDLEKLEEYFSFYLYKNKIEKESKDEELIESILINLPKYDNIKQFNHFLDDLLKRLNYLYLKPISNRLLFEKITIQMEIFNFIGYISNLIKTIYKSNLLTIDSAIRDIFITICRIIILYGDSCLSFRIKASRSNLFKIMVKLIRKDPRDDPLRNECIDYLIRCLYNLTRLENETTRFTQLKIAELLINKLPQIECNKTRLSAVLCIGWTMQTDEIQNQDKLFSQISFQESIMYAFSLLDKALQTGNNNYEQMFICFLDQYGRLPYYWAFEIVDGIGKWGKNHEIRTYIAMQNHKFMFKWIIDLYSKGNLIEKELAINAIKEFIEESNLFKLVSENQYFLYLIRKDLNINSDILKYNLTQIQFKILFVPNINSIKYLSPDHKLSCSQLNSFINDLNVDLDCLQIIYNEFKSKILFYQAHESLLNEISNYIEKKNYKIFNTKELRAVSLVNLILIKIKFFLISLMKINNLNSNEIDKFCDRNNYVNCKNVIKYSSEVSNSSYNKHQRVIQKDYIELLHSRVLNAQEFSILIDYLMFEPDCGFKAVKKVSSFLKYSIESFKKILN